MPPKSKKRKLSSAAANDNSNNEKENQTLRPYLHHDTWFEILSWLSATCLYNIVSRVSNTWAAMIRRPCFVDKHLRRSRSGIFVQGNMINYFLEVISGNVEITEFELECPGMVYSSYQGVCLFYNYSTNADYVMNLVTTQSVEISRPVVVPKYRKSCNGMLNFSVIRDRCSGELKLVYAIQRNNGECSWYVQKLGIENSWKRISASHTSETIVDFPGMSIGGFVVYQVCNSVLVFDVSDETIRMICSPDIEHSQVTYIQMGNDLSCFSRKSERIFIHVLSDFHAGKWSLYHLLDYGFIPQQPLEFLHFLGWINNSEELLVRLCTFESCNVLGSCYKGSCYVTLVGSCFKSDHRYRFAVGDKWIYCTYNLKTKRITNLNKYITITALDRVQVHTNSLISWKPLQA